jgi:phosphomannomutase / phosphoglucomutase
MRPMGQARGFLERLHIGIATDAIQHVTRQAACIGGSPKACQQRYCQYWPDQSFAECTPRFWQGVQGWLINRGHMIHGSHFPMTWATLPADADHLRCERGKRMTMMKAPRADIKPNSWDFENLPLIAPTGFREYDARWWFGHPGSDKDPQINLLGLQQLGLSLGTLIHELGVRPAIIVGHDFRSYSLSVKQALTLGLLSSGVDVHDIGLAISPMAYFAQFHLDIDCVAMVTASHNANGWTGVKMGVEPPLTFGPAEMARLRDIALAGQGRARTSGQYSFVSGMRDAYMADLTRDMRFTRPIKAVIATGNGTAGAFAPEALEQLGVEVIALDAELDHSFPNYNPNPEDMKMLHVLADGVRAHGADIGLAFDGDGDRCGVVDNEGNEIFADKVGVMLARDMSSVFPEARFVVDVKSTGLFGTDPVLKANGTSTEYWKTGHSYIKRRSREIGALAGFEKSVHFFLQPPLGRGYDDGIGAALAILTMLDRNPSSTIADLYRALPRTWASPTMSPACADEIKYQVIDRIIADYQGEYEKGGEILGQKIESVVTVNGARVTLADGTWGLVRASSNTPNLVIVVESPVTEERMTAMFRDIERRLAAYPEIGAFDQKI